MSVQTRIVILPSLVLGPIRAESLSVLTQDLSYFQHSLGHKVDAIVGLDVLRKSSFSINYRTKGNTLRSDREPELSPAPFESDTPIVTIGMEIQTRQKRIVIDTGSPELMLFRSRMPRPVSLRLLWNRYGDGRRWNISAQKSADP